MPGSEALLWERFRAQGDMAAREELVCLHLSYARIMAATFYARRYHDEISFADYLQLACVGLLESIDRFDPAHGVQFRTFASRRVQGAILNGLEHETEKQQQIAARKRLQAQRLESAKAMAADKAASKEPDQLLAYLAEVGLGLALSWMLEGTGMVESGAEPSETLPFYRSVELQQLRRRIADLVHSLPAQQAQVVRYHYMQGLPFEEIATTLALTKGRISQIHKQALTTLRETLQSRRNFDASW